VSCNKFLAAFSELKKQRQKEEGAKQKGKKPHKKKEGK
jgi:hypothetical protein